MINSTNTVNIDGVKFNEFDINDVFATGRDDNFGRWVVRPLAIVAAIGIAVAAFFASAMLIVVSVALLPLLAVAMWAMKTKLQRDLEAVAANTKADAEAEVAGDSQPVS